MMAMKPSFLSNPGAETSKLLQVVQLVIDGDPQGLEGSRCRVFLGLYFPSGARKRTAHGGTPTALSS